MPRKTRIHYDGALYHVMARGNNGEYILAKEKDKQNYMNLIYKYKEKYDFILYAYCIMSNHVHMLIQVNEAPLSKIMQGIQQVYTQRYNKINNRTGHVFQQRYKAILCNREEYLIYLTKYIHMNPVKAGIKEGLNYKWSSYTDYIKGKSQLVDIDFVLQTISTNKAAAIKEYSKYMNEELEYIDSCEYTIKEPIVNTINYDINKKDIEDLIKEVLEEENLTREELISKSRIKKISRARKKIIVKSEKECEIKNTDLARILNISTTAISKTRSRAN